MNIDTSKETGYVAQSSVASDELIVTKETGYVAQSSLPEGVVVMKETCYVVLKPLNLDTIGRVEFSGETRVKGIVVIP